MVAQLKDRIPLFVVAVVASVIALLAPEATARVAIVVAALSAWWPGFTGVFFAALLVRPLRSPPSGWCPPEGSDVVSRCVASALSFAALSFVHPRLTAATIGTTILCALVLAVVAHTVDRLRSDESSRPTPPRSAR
jgi:hypothetical protein